MAEAAAAQLLGWVVLPAWLAAGAADWACHRATRIEHTSGPRESAIHALMLAEVGAAVALALWCQVNALVLAANVTALAVHQATAGWDLRVAAPARAVHPREQQVHSLLEVLPLTGLMLLALAHPQAWTAPLDWRLAWKDPPLALAVQAGVLAGAGAVGLLYARELRRCRRARVRPPAT